MKRRKRKKKRSKRRIANIFEQMKRRRKPTARPMGGRREKTSKEKKAESNERKKQPKWSNNIFAIEKRIFDISKRAMSWMWDILFCESPTMKSMLESSVGAYAVHYKRLMYLMLFGLGYGLLTRPLSAEYCPFRSSSLTADYIPEMHRPIDERFDESPRRWMPIEIRFQLTLFHFGLTD